MLNRLNVFFKLFVWQDVCPHVVLTGVTWDTSSCPSVSLVFLRIPPFFWLWPPFRMWLLLQIFVFVWHRSLFLLLQLVLFQQAMWVCKQKTPPGWDGGCERNSHRLVPKLSCQLGSDNLEATTWKRQVGSDNSEATTWERQLGSDNLEATTRKRPLWSDKLEATTRKRQLGSDN